MATEPISEHRFSVGDTVCDEGDESNPMIIVDATGERADQYAYTWDAHMNEITVADADSNADYPDSDPAVEAVYVTGLDERFGSEWRNKGIEFILSAVDNSKIKTYAYPESRLDEVPGGQAIFD